MYIDNTKDICACGQRVLAKPEAHKVDKVHRGMRVSPTLIASEQDIRNINISKENSHTAMLDFGMTKESDSGLVALAPNGSTGKVKGVVVLEYRVGLLGKNLKVGLKKMRKGAHRYM